MNFENLDYETDKSSNSIEKIVITNRIIKKRRTKYFENEIKEYKCGCLKDYFSYPALYTHVRNKHNKIFPIGSYSQKNILLNEFENKNNNINKFIDFKKFVNNKNLLDYKEFLLRNKIKPNISKQILWENNIIYLTIKDQIGKFEFIEEFLSDFKEFFSKYIKIKDNNVYLNEPFIKENKNTLDSYQILFHFLFYNYFITNKEYIQDIVILVIINIQSCKEYINQLNSRNKEIIEYNKSDIAMFLKSSNEFLNITFYDKFNWYYKNKLKYFGDQDEQIYNLIFFIKFLNNWFFIENYTKFKTEIHYELLIDK